jgi:Domain of unknown function (DUF4424)
MLRRLLSALMLTAAAAPALANDSIAELGTGGLVLSRSDVVAMEKEDLFISRDKVTVDYVFRNSSDEDVSTIVAFPMPDIEGNPYEMPSIPRMGEDNFLGFEVSVDGQPVKPELEHRAIAVGIDISDELKANNVPFYPFGEATTKALEALPQQVADDWLNRGIMIIDEYDDGSGMKKVRTPFWQLRSTYWWRMVFPAGKSVKVAHSYQPSVGGTVGLTFLEDGKFQGQTYDDYKRRYCMDASFERAVLKEVGKTADGSPTFYENRIAYILRTGGNWASGNIGDFTLTIDKGDPDSLLTFCGKNVEKIGPTTFRMKASDFYPDTDLDILILTRPGNASEGGN